MNILVIRGGAIGDFILTLPALTALRGLAKDGRLEVLGYPRIASLALDSGIVDGVRSIESASLARFFVRGASLNQTAAAYFAEFQLIVSYLYDPDQVFQRNVKGCTAARYIAGRHRPDETLRQHATEVFLKPLEELGITKAAAEPKLTWAEPSPFCAQYSAGPWLAVHPGSGSERKNWPEKNWLGLLKSLPGAWQILLIGGEAEGERLPRLRDALPGDRIQLACDLPLPELAQRMRCCRAFIGHDSGISHLAAAVGLPGLVLWGETVQEIWSPRSLRMRVLKEAGGLKELSIDKVLQELKDVVRAGAKDPL